MVRTVVARLTIASPQNIFASGHTESKKDTSNKNKLSSPPTECAAHSKKVEVSYPVGSTTLQLTGAHFSLRGGPRSDNIDGNTRDGVVVLLQAHVGGELDSEARVFTVAAVALGGHQSMDGAEYRSNKRSRVSDSRQLALPDDGQREVTTSPRPGSRPLTAFVKLDLRLQMERVSFSLVAIPAGKGDVHATRDNIRKDKGNNTSAAANRSVLVTVMGVVSPLVL
ncbi:uncharacterized protein TEOVI_000389600 [Trypanosoma equiperdum]|uniref:Uncharacterized protein n=1 Tax=Trypanosoma equiperdum TaxID=5694 RepID=A0A1G4IJ27_TRYEQ|nr:hypothetical protein TEOVI_000389600 [Trypanosoma equiperdum]